MRRPARHWKLERIELAAGTTMPSGWSVWLYNPVVDDIVYRDVYRAASSRRIHVDFFDLSRTRQRGGLQPLVHFLRSFERFLNVVANIVFANDLLELSLMHEFAWLFSRAAQN